MTSFARKFAAERGQVIVFTVITLTVMLGLAAAVIDVGSWYRADRKLQTTVDAAALAAAQELPSDTAAAAALATEYAGKNGGGPITTSFSATAVANDTVTVTGSRPAPGFFSKIFGIDSVTVGATATARVAAIDTARRVAPIGVDYQHPELGCDPAPCSTASTELDLNKVGPGAFRLLNVDGSSGGTSPGTLEDWIMNGLEGDMPLGWYYSDPGAKYNSGQFKSALDAVIGQELLFPVYRAFRGSGSGFEYEVIGWTGFVITGYDISGSKNGKIFGHFTEVIWEGLAGEEVPSEDFGARVVSLVG
jgi:Flp pilus assembly protein TadG